MPRSARDVALQLRAVAGLPAAQKRDRATRSALALVDASLERDVVRPFAPPQGDWPVTLGIGEPFTTTLTVPILGSGAPTSFNCDCGSSLARTRVFDTAALLLRELTVTLLPLGALTTSSKMYSFSHLFLPAEL